MHGVKEHYGVLDSAMRLLLRCNPDVESQMSARELLAGIMYLGASFHGVPLRKDYLRLLAEELEVEHKAIIKAQYVMSNCIGQTIDF